MKLEITVHVHHHNDESLALIREIHVGLKEGKFTMALSPEMQAFLDSNSAFLTRTGAALTNLSADIQRLIAASTGMSQEDKDALLQVVQTQTTLAQQLDDAAAVVPEPPA